MAYSRALPAEDTGASSSTEPSTELPTLPELPDLPDLPGMDEALYGD